MKQLSRRRGRQGGVIMIISMIMLVLITLVSMSSIRSSALEEKMAGNSFDRQKAFQAAEGAVRICLTKVDSGTYLGTLLTPAAIGSQNHWEVAANWDATSSNSTAISDIDTADAGLSEAPRCMVEDLDHGSYRVTGRATGGTDTTVVMLQATYSQE